jgi:hypothetical protein
MFFKPDAFENGNARDMFVQKDVSGDVCAVDEGWRVCKRRCGGTGGGVAGVQHQSHEDHEEGGGRTTQPV